VARNFRRPRAAQPIAELNVTNLIDLGFMLLIIFMVATPLIQKEQTMAVKLPTEAKTPQDRPDPTLRTETVTIDAKGNFYLDGRALSFRELQVQLRAFSGEPRQPIIRLGGDEASIWKYEAQLIAELKKDNLLKLEIATEADR